MKDESGLPLQAKEGDRDALGDLYDDYAPLVYAYAYRRVGDPDVAEDLTGEVFVRVVAAVRSGHTWHTSFRAWLYRVAHNLVVDYCRRQVREPSLSLEETWSAAEGQDPGERAQSALDRERLRRALACLTPQQQEVLALRYGEGLTARETARILDKTVGAVEALQHRALAALKRVLLRGAGDARSGTPARAPRRRGIAPARKAGTEV